MTDHDLILEFARNRSEDAFRRLVDRHCDLVHSVASRVARNPELARDVSQQVFSRLAAKPGSVPSGVPLSAWLHRTCHSLAVDLVRSEESRRKRETTVATSPLMNSEPSPDWARLEPVIDALIDELPEIERRAVVMRFYEKRSHGAIGASLGLSEEAARKRLDRALDRLRNLLAKRGITTSSAALASILPAHAIAPAPAGLSASLSSAALATATVTIPLTTTLIVIMSHKASIAAASLLLLAGVAVVAVPTLTRDKPTARAADRNSGGGSSGASAFGSPGQPRSKNRGNAAVERLSGRYGDSRAKLSAHIHGEFVGLLEDTMSLIDIASKMDPEEVASGAEEIFGDSAGLLALTDEQQHKLAALQTESLKREGEKMRGLIATLKEDPSEFMEYLLLQDAAKRGDLERSEYDRLRALLDIPEEDLQLSLGEAEEEDPLDDEVFVADLIKALDERQAEVLRDMVEARKQKQSAEPGDLASLEEIEKEIASGRKMIGGALQMMEGMTGGGVNPR